MKKALSLLLVVLLVIGMIPMTPLAAEVEIPAELNIVEMSAGSAFEKGETINFTQWGSEKSADSWVVTIPADTETVTITFKGDAVPTPYNDYNTGVLKLSGGWLSYNADEGTYSMGGIELDCDNSSGNPTVTLDVASMIENGNYYGVYDTSYGVQYLLGFKYAEAEGGEGDEGESTDKAEVPAELNIVEMSAGSAFEKGETINFTQWGSEESADSWVVTIPADTETVTITFKGDAVPTPYNDYNTGVLKLSGGWLSYNADEGTYSMGGIELDCDNSSGNPTVTLDVASMIENGNYYGVYDTSYGVQYLLGFKYAEAEGGEGNEGETTTSPKITLSTDAEKLSVGAEFTVTATISDNEGFSSMTLKLNWNKRYVEFTGFSVINEDGEEYLDSDLANVRNMSVEFNQEKGIITAARTSDSSMNGTLFVANFVVIDNGEAEISLKKEFPDFVLSTADGTDVEVTFDESAVEGLGSRIPATAIVLGSSELTIEEGSNALLTVTLEPADASDTAIFSSSDESVATVDEIGTITAVKAGTATITVTAGDVSATCAVTVEPEKNIIKKNDEDSVMTGVKSITFKGEKIELRNIYKVTFEGHEEAYIYNSESNSGSTFCAYTLDGYEFFGHTWGVIIPDLRVNINEPYVSINTRDSLVSYDDLKAAVGDENIDKLGVNEDDKLALVIFTPGTALFNYAVLFVIEDVELEGISVPETLEIIKGESASLKASPIPSGADAVVTWSSSDESVAIVDENGKVTAVNAGTATITATSGSFSDTCEVTVKTRIGNIPSNGDRAGCVDDITVKGVVVNNFKWEDKTVTIYVDEDTNTTATVKIDWHHSYNQHDAEEVEVEIKNGEGIYDGFTQYGNWVIKFAPTVPTTSIELPENLEVVVNCEETLEVTLNVGATDDVTWTSSDESVATVDRDGKVKGVAEGTAVITAKSNGLEATCNVKVVYVHAESVIISGDGIENGKLSLKIDDKKEIVITVNPEKHSDEIIVRSSDFNIARADVYSIQGRKEGTATVTVTVGEATATLEVEVYAVHAESITLDYDELTLYTKESKLIVAAVGPEGHTDGKPVWTSSDETVATVDKNGTVTAVSEGEAVITATINGMEATCKVTVKGEPEEGTVLYKNESGIDWPEYMPGQVGWLILEDAKYESISNEGDTYTVIMPASIGKDGEFKIRVVATGSGLGINWNDDPENVWEYTVKLVDGEATVKIRAYKASGPGASREGTKTYKFIVAEPDVLLGDVNGDGKVNATDAALLYRYVNNKDELTDEQLAAADVNGDGKVNASDAALIYRYVNNKLDVFPAEQQ